MNTGPEFLEVEQPLIDQLVSMGRKHTSGSLENPNATDREGFRDVLLQGDLRQALCRINPDLDGNPWLDDERITQAVNALQRLGTAKLLEANQDATELLLKGTAMTGSGLVFCFLLLLDYSAHTGIWSWLSGKAVTSALSSAAELVTLASKQSATCPPVRSGLCVLQGNLRRLATPVGG